MKLSYYMCVYLVVRPFSWYQKFWHVILTFIFGLLLKKLNLGFNFWTERDRAFIVYIRVPCDKTFLSLQKNVDLMTLTFDLLLKKLNLRHNVLTKRDGAFILHGFFRAQEPKAPVTYCDHALSGVRPSVVRPSSVKLFTFSTSSPEPLDGFWWNLVWMKYSRSLTSVVVFRPDPSRGGSRAGQK